MIGERLSAFEGAKLLAARGLPVAPCPRGSKAPNRKGWKDHATRNLDILETWFDGDSCNVAVPTEGLVVVDDDTRKKGLPNWPFASALPRTLTAQTPSGGRHYYYKCPEGVSVPGSVEKIADGVDIRAEGNHVIGPGSVFEGKPYLFIDLSPLADAPEWLIALCQGHRAPKSEVRVVGELDTPAAIESAAAYLKGAAPAAIEGSGGDTTTYKVACAVLDRGVSPETALELMLDRWNDRCSPPWEPEDLEAKVRSAVNSRQAPIGRDNPAAGFCVIEMPKPAPPRKLLKFARDISMDVIKERATNATVKGLFGPGDLIISYGPSTAAKTFGVLDRCIHQAKGLVWMGRKTKRSPVLYVCLEGEHGFEKRMEAVKRRYGDPGDYFAVLAVPVMLVRNPAVGAEGVKTILAAFKELLALTGEATGHIVIDTYSQAIAGDDENTAEDFMHFVGHRINPIRHETGASIELTHHTNKEGDIRGTSSMKPTVDCMLRYDRNGDIRTVTAEKVKDGEDNVVVQTFALEQVCLGIDDDGVPITSCIVKSCDQPIAPKSKKPARESKGHKSLRAALASATAKRLLIDVADPDTGESAKRLLLEALRPEFYAVYRADSIASKSQAFRRATDEPPPGLKVKAIEGVDYIWLDDADWQSATGG